MSWGGTRSGAGRKPKGDRPLRARRNVARPVFMTVDGGKVDEETISVAPPEDLPAEQTAFWRRNAPRAIAQGTLTPRTIEAFRLLCELERERTETKKTIDRDGRTFIKVTIDGSGQEHQELKAHPLKGDYARLSKQVENLMGRFRLAPFGKAEAVIRPTCWLAGLRPANGCGWRASATVAIWTGRAPRASPTSSNRSLVDASARWPSGSRTSKGQRLRLSGGTRRIARFGIRLCSSRGSAGI